MQHARARPRGRRGVRCSHAWHVHDHADQELQGRRLTVRIRREKNAEEERRKWVRIEGQRKRMHFNIS